MALKENYKDDILDVSVNTKRKYRMTENQDGTVSFDDETEYLQEGDNFGSGAINPIAHAINGLNNYTFNPSGSIDLVAYIADDSYYLNEDNKYVLADSPTGQALITSEPSTYKALASNTDLYGIEGEDTVSGFEPSCTPITTPEGETLSTIDEKINYLLANKIAINDLLALSEKIGSISLSDSYTSDFNGQILIVIGCFGYNGSGSFTSTIKKNNVTQNDIIHSPVLMLQGRMQLFIYLIDIKPDDGVTVNVTNDSHSSQREGIISGIYKLQ